MRCDTKQHTFSCGIDRHARTMSVCLLRQEGEVVLHRHMQASPDAVLKTITPYRDDIVIAVAWLVTWYGLADLWAQDGLPFVLGQALSLQASQGGQAKNDPLDSQSIAVLRRGAGSRRPLSLPRRCGRPGPASGDGCLCCAHGRHCLHPSSIRTARTLGPRSGRRWPPRASGPAWRNGALRQPSGRASRATSPSLTTTLGCAAMWHCLASRRQSRTRHQPFPAAIRPWHRHDGACGGAGGDA